MSTEEQVKAQFSKLVKEGTEILRAAGWSGKDIDHHPGQHEYLRFRTEAMNLIRRSCGEDSDHYRELKRIAEAKESSTNAYYLMHCFGIVEAAQRDFAAGLLFDMKALIAAELLGDFIEQTEVLLEAGYHVPAASLAGAVLEDTLRKLCSKHNVRFPASTKIDSLNSELGCLR